MKAAQIAYVVMTLLFLGAALVLLMANTAILAAVVCLILSGFGFIVFTTMIMSDAGVTKPRE